MTQLGLRWNQLLERASELRGPINSVALQTELAAHTVMAPSANPVTEPMAKPMTEPAADTMTNIAAEPKTSLLRLRILESPWGVVLFRARELRSSGSKFLRET